jgi:CRP-like cAMP-binding protein
MAASLPEAAWAKLAAGGVSRVFDPGQVLLRQGDPADHVLLVLDGRVKVSRVDPEGNTLVLAVRGAGELMGELGVLDRQHRRSATVVAIDRCSTRVISADEFRDMARSLGLETRMLEHVVQRLQEGEDVRAELSSLPAGPRLARCLLRFAVPRRPSRLRPVVHPDRIDVGLNQTELGQAAGVHRSTVAQELRKLREDGIVVTSRGRIVITDLAGLRERAGE